MGFDTSMIKGYALFPISLAASSSFFILRPAKITKQPSVASALDTASPIPLPAPVIKAIFFVIPKFISEKNKFSDEYFKNLYPNSYCKKTNEIKSIFQHMNAKQINNLILQGHEIGLHGFEHEDSGKIKTFELEEKINSSKNIFK